MPLLYDDNHMNQVCDNCCCMLQQWVSVRMNNHKSCDCVTLNSSMWAYNVTVSYLESSTALDSTTGFLLCNFLPQVGGIKQYLSLHASMLTNKSIRFPNKHYFVSEPLKAEWAVLILKF